MPHIMDSKLMDTSSSFGNDAEACVSAESLLDLFHKQKRYTNNFFDLLDMGPVEQCCQALLRCTGTIYMTGVGKSGVIAQQICQVLVSTGTRATFLSPTDALHGDIGIVGEHDVIVLFSKSGSTEELLKLIPFVKARGVITVGVTCVLHNKLGKLTDIAVHLPLEHELCPFNLAPVTSTALQLLFGNTLSVALMNAKELSRDSYARNHPAGRIGKRLMLTVRSIMIVGDALPTVRDQPVVDALAELTAKSCGCVLVVDSEQRLRGVFTDGDLRRSIQELGGEGLQLPLSEFMTRSPKTIDPEAMAVEALQVMEEGGRKVTVMPVVEDDMTVVGLVSLHSLVTAGL